MEGTSCTRFAARTCGPGFGGTGCCDVGMRDGTAGCCVHDLASLVSVSGERVKNVGQKDGGNKVGPESLD